MDTPWVEDIQAEDIPWVAEAVILVAEIRRILTMMIDTEKGRVREKGSTLVVVETAAAVEEVLIEIDIVAAEVVAVGITVIQTDIVAVVVEAEVVAITIVMENLDVVIEGARFCGEKCHGKSLRRLLL